jgi:hypothetical protein
VGGFSSYAFQIYLRMDRPLLGPGVLDRLQKALRVGAPTWSSRLRVAGVGVWPVRGPVDVSEPGSLDAVLRSHLPGGAKFPRTIGDAHSFDAHVRLGGTDRGVTFALGVEASLRGADPKRPADFVFVETTKPEIDAVPAPDWIEPLFRALCRELQPAIATASSMGERGAQGRVYGPGDPHIGWLTYFGSAESADLDMSKLRQVDGLELERFGEGLLLRLGPAPSTRRWTGPWTSRRRSWLDARCRACPAASSVGDPKTQILITRERVLAALWRDVAAGTLEFFGIEGFLRTSGDSFVEVACPRANDFQERLASFARLREAGIAEPD